MGFRIQRAERGDASAFMYLDAARSLTGAAFSASAWLSMPQPLDRDFFFSFPTEGFRLAAGVVNRLLQYALLQRAMPETHTPGPGASNGSRATFAAAGGVRILHSTLPQTVSLSMHWIWAPAAACTMYIWRVADGQG